MHISYLNFTGVNTILESTLVLTFITKTKYKYGKKKEKNGVNKL